MSIRLRLTLLYSTILALTLIAFGTLLYVTQARATYDSLRTNLARQAEGIANGPRHPQLPAGEPPANATAPDNSTLPENSILPGRWTQIRLADGTITARTPDLSGTTLPLSAAGLVAVQRGSVSVETAQVDNEPLLIYSQPMTTPGGVHQIVQVATPMVQREQALSTLRLILIAGGILVILVAFVVGWILAGMALSPIHRITQTARAIGAERDFGRRVQHEGPQDEIGQLATTFNTMLTELESSYRQVEEALQAQRRFVADASHELRTPLTTVRGNIELLRHEPPLEDKERVDVLADAKDEVERLIRLVNQLLVLARADAGRPLRCEPLVLQPLLEDVYREVKRMAPQRTITCDTSPDAMVFGDRDALKQVLLILLDNALVHTPSQAAIRVETDFQDQRVAIRIRDTGKGISPEVLPHLFERFYRGDSSRTGRGTGLGLAIAKELIQAQDGTLTVASQVGQGTVFTLTLAQATVGVTAR